MFTWIRNLFKSRDYHLGTANPPKPFPSKAKERYLVFIYLNLTDGSVVRMDKEYNNYYTTSEILEDLMAHRWFPVRDKLINPRIVDSIDVGTMTRIEA